MVMTGLEINPESSLSETKQSENLVHTDHTDLQKVVLRLVWRPRPILSTTSVIAGLYSRLLLLGRSCLSVYLLLVDVKVHQKQHPNLVDSRSLSGFLVNSGNFWMKTAVEVTTHIMSAS